jgi:pimeloyl-ACP methyl ester carboxylesterase
MTVKEQIRKPGIIAALLLGLALGVPPVVWANWGWGLVSWAAGTVVLCGLSVGAERLLARNPDPIPLPPPPPPPPGDHQPPPPAPLPADRQGERVAVVFVHGLFSDPSAWFHFDKLITADPELESLGLHYFTYATPLMNVDPRRTIPNLDMVGRQLGTYLENIFDDYPEVVLVTHSQGGLAAQLLIARVLTSGEEHDLARIKQLIMFACPNAGSELFLTVRRFLSWHPQERDLRPLNKQINEAHGVLLNKVIHAKQVTSHTCPIPITVYAGAEDNVVTPASAFSVLPYKHTGVLAGDHSTVIQPRSSADPTYRTLKKKLKAVLGDQQQAQ